MTAEEKTAVGAAAAAAAATWATPEERSEIASSFALATAANLGMSAEAQQPSCRWRLRLLAGLNTFRMSMYS